MMVISMFRCIFAISVLLVLKDAKTVQSTVFGFGSDCGNDKSHHFIFGSRQIDELLYTERIRERYIFLRKVSVSVQVPVIGTDPPRVKNITYIKALDQKTDRSGGCVYITEGGIGDNHVTLQIISQKNQDIDHMVYVYDLQAFADRGISIDLPITPLLGVRYIVARRRDEEVSRKILLEEMLGKGVPNQVNIAYNTLKNTTKDTFYVDEGSTCPVFTSRFCHINGSEHFLASANEDGKLIVQNTNNLQCTSVQAHNNAIFDLAWMNFDLKLVTASGDHSSNLWQLGEGDVRSLFQFYGHFHSVKTISCKPNDNCVFATGSRDGAISTWDTRINVAGTSVKPDVTIDCSKRTQGIAKGKKQSSLPHSITGLAYQDEYTLVSCSAGEGVIKVWDMRKSYSVHRAPVPKLTLRQGGDTGKKGFSSLAMSPCRLRLYANCIDGNIYCYNIGTYNNDPIGRYEGHTVSDFYIKTGVSPDGRYISSGSGDHHGYIWSVSHPRPLVRLVGHTAEVTCVDWATKGELKVASCSDDATWRLWRLHPEEVETNDPSLRGWAETCVRRPSPRRKRSILKRKRSGISEIDLNSCSLSRLIVSEEDEDRSQNHSNEEKKLKVSPSKDMSQFIGNLPNYILDGTSPHAHTCNLLHSPKSDKDWLTKLRNSTPSPSRQKSPLRRKSTNGRKRGNLLTYFRVTSRQQQNDCTTCELPAKTDIKSPSIVS